jgi:o-succinylbenzoate---CoA ligase
MINWQLRSLVTGQALRWQNLLPGVADWCRWLLEQDLPQGSRLAVCLPNSPSLAALLQAAPLVGHSLVVLPRRLAASQEELIRHAACHLLIDHPLEPVTTGTPLSARPLAPEQEALVVFTSGSTGQAKGVRLRLSNLLHAAEAQCQALDLRSQDRWLLCLPMDHIGGAMSCYRAATSGSDLCIHKRFTVDRCWQALSKCSGVSLVPTMLHRLLAERSDAWPPALRQILLGGGPCEPADLDRAEARGLRPRLSYGLSESTALAAITPAGSRAHRAQPLPGIELRLRDERIELRGPQMFCGYLHEPDREPQTWFDTGDLGKWDEDGLRVLCRRQDRIVSGGENIAPSAVAAALRAHPGICEAAVWGEADAEWGQIVVAALVASGEPVPEPELRAWLRQGLPAYQIPKRWSWLAALPRLANGKVDHATLLNGRR